MDARHQRSRRPVLEVRKVQAQEVPEHLAAQHRVHAVSRMQHEVLPEPTHRRVEKEEHSQTHRDRDQGALGLMDYDLVDHDLGAKRRGEADQLNEEGGEQHVAPDTLVLEERRPEPAEAEFAVRRRPIATGGLRRGFAPDQNDTRRELFL